MKSQPEADPPSAEMGLCLTKVLLVPIVPKVPMVANVLNGLNSLNVLNVVFTKLDSLLARGPVGLTVESGLSKSISRTTPACQLKLLARFAPFPTP